MWREAYAGWVEKRLTQEEAGTLLGVCRRTFRRYLERLREADEFWIELLDSVLGAGQVFNPVLGAV